MKEVREKVLDKMTSRTDTREKSVSGCARARVQQHCAVFLCRRLRDRRLAEGDRR